MLSKKIYSVLGENKDLGNKLHTHYVYSCERNVQRETRVKMKGILQEFSDTKLLGLAFDPISKNLLDRKSVV
jgi:hypothetical protein